MPQHVVQREFERMLCNIFGLDPGQTQEVEITIKISAGEVMKVFIKKLAEPDEVTGVTELFETTTFEMRPVKVQK
jgi:hypothetical protein